MQDTLTTVVPSIVAYGVVWGGLAARLACRWASWWRCASLVTTRDREYITLPMLQSGARRGFWW